jgi:hypothetical protein
MVGLAVITRDPTVFAVLAFFKFAIASILAATWSGAVIFACVDGQ